MRLPLSSAGTLTLNVVSLSESWQSNVSTLIMLLEMWISLSLKYFRHGQCLLQPLDGAIDHDSVYLASFWWFLECFISHTIKVFEPIMYSVCKSHKTNKYSPVIQRTTFILIYIYNLLLSSYFQEQRVQVKYLGYDQEQTSKLWHWVVGKSDLQ